MRKAIGSVLGLGFVLAGAGAGAAAETKALPVGAGLVAGYYQGVNTASQLPGAKVPVALVLNQAGPVVTGGYVAASGVYGTGTGTFSGDQGTMTWTNTTPGCPGTYTNTYKLSGETLSWTYTGKDCLGAETGSGTAVRVPITDGAAKP